MEDTLFRFGMHKLPEGISERYEQVADEWTAEKDLSSLVSIRPGSSSIIEKRKKRSLDKTILEVGSTLFFSELTERYNSALPNADMTLYSPQTVEFTYPKPDKQHPSPEDMLIAMFFCPGLPLNKIPMRKERAYQVHDERVRVEARVNYLAGTVSRMLEREGVVHGDPQLRHFLLLPKNGLAYRLDRDDNAVKTKTRNGIGIIDVEGCRIQDENAADVRAEQEKFKDRVMTKFCLGRAEYFYDLGRTHLDEHMNGHRFLEDAYHTAKKVFASRFTEDIKDFDLRKRTITYR